MTERDAVEDLVDALKIHENYYMEVSGIADFTDGWKLSIQGHTLEDSKYLFERLFSLLFATGAYFKLASQKLIDLKNEQSTKLLTIYIPNNVDPKSFAELVRLNIIDYKGANDILEKRSYTKYANGIFYRNDRNSEGQYIPA